MVVAIPDLEKVASDYLRTYAALVSLGARVVGKSPSNTDAPWVRVTQLDASSDHRSDHLVDYLLQLDCYAGRTGGQPEANSLGRSVRKALVEMPDASHSAEVSGVMITGHARVPDTDVDEPARERVVISAVVWAHA